MKIRFLKTASVCLAAALVCVSLVSCGGVSQEDYEKLEKRVAMLEKETGIETKDNEGTSSKLASNRDKSEEAEGSENFDEKEVSDNVRIQQHDYVDNDDNKFSIFTFENNSDYNVNARIKIVTKDKNGKELEEQEKTIKGLPKSKKSYASFKLDPDTETIVRTVSYTEYTSRDNPLDDINARVTKAEGGANIIVKNGSSSEIKNINYMTLFYKGTSLVGFDNGDVPNVSANSSEVIPSEFYEDFDRVEVYFAAK